jgi:hypothetical protein
MRDRWLWLLLVAPLLLGCESKEGNADSISGSGVEVNCALKRAGLAALPNQGVGDTRVDVACAPPE